MSGSAAPATSFSWPRTAGNSSRNSIKPCWGDLWYERRARIPPIPRSPFRGIESFRYVDRAVFFAREEEVERLVRAIEVYRGMLLYGDSGCGKSSLINAGLLPRMLAAGFNPHRLRVQPKPDAEILVERVAISADGRGPFLPSIFTNND